jgi:alkaline phosphatase D
MRFPRREALKLGAFGLFGATCAAHSESTSVVEPLAPGPSQLAVPNPRRFTLTYGSCNKPTLPQPLWDWVRAQKPDAWMWLGDIVYADTEDISKTRRLYAEQSRRAEYAAVVAETRIIGIWDDHDFGKNDAGKEYPKKVESQAALLDFLGEPKDSARRARLGTYESYDFGAGDERVKVIMLDGRYHRDPPAPDGDTLGRDQWAWFERELVGSTAALTVVASGYQVLPEDHHNEKWANFPRARTRLLELVAHAKKTRVVLVSGDRHFSELSRVDDRRIGYPLYELTSSGLTHSYPHVDERNRHRVGKIYPYLNFGAVTVDWDKREATLATRGSDGGLPIEQKIALDHLRRKG